MNRLVVWAVFIAAVALAFRLPGLDHRPMHADEAILADKFGTLLEHGRFQYDPHDYHGPVLEYLTLIPAAIRNQRSFAALDEWTLRMVPVTAGVLLALSPLLLANVIGQISAVSAGMLIAISEPLVFYSRDYIPEMLLGLFTALFVTSLLHRRWIVAGFLAGLAAGTKETAVIAIAVAVVVFPWPGWKAFLRFITVLTLVSIALLGRSDVTAAAQSYWIRSAAPGWHVHPWTYYAELLIQGTAPVLLLAVFGMKQDWRLAAYSGLLIAIYSMIPYKTPWCVVSMVWALTLIAGLGVQWLTTRQPRWVFVICGVLCLASIGQSVRKTKLWTYSETSPDVFRIVAAVQHFAPNQRTWIGVYTTENLWPLPWYFRQYSNLRWSREVTISGRAPGVLLVTPELEDALTRKLYEAPPPGERELYVPMFDRTVELRSGVAVRGYVSKSVWEAARVMAQ